MRDPDGSAARLFIALQYLLPQHGLSRLVHALARLRMRWLKNALIGAFMRGFKPDLSDAIEKDPRAYASFNAFFTRALEPGARPLAAGEATLVSPVDGTVSECGDIVGDRLLQAKGHYYTLDALLAGREPLAGRFAGGRFATIYLAPYNYHRIHMPLAGRLVATRYVPGALYSVNDATARAVPGLFARNERVVCEFDTALGPLAMVLVGALFVGSIETVHAGEINPPAARGGLVRAVETGLGTHFDKGTELGRFNMGSTVVLLLGHGGTRFTEHLGPGATVRTGQRLARVA